MPSAGTLTTLLTKESFDFVGIETLERAIQQGEGAHEVACNYSLYRLKHFQEIQPLPPMPAEHPDTLDRWNAAMALALTQVEVLFNQYEVEPIAVEEPSICSTYGFGGQPDIKLKMKWKGKRILAVWDYKRVAALSLSHHLKLECYKMLDAYQDCQSGFIAWLKKDGPSQLVHIPSNLRHKTAISCAAGFVNFQIAEKVIVP